MATAAATDQSLEKSLKRGNDQNLLRKNEIVKGTHAVLSAALSNDPFLTDHDRRRSDLVAADPKLLSTLAMFYFDLYSEIRMIVHLISSDRSIHNFHSNLAFNGLYLIYDNCLSYKNQFNMHVT